MTQKPTFAAISMHDLRVTRGRREVLALESLEVMSGETVAVLGPNGAGKSTLLLAAALLIPASGDIRYSGTAYRGRNAVALRRLTSTVFQDASLLDMSARRNVEEALAIHGVASEERRQLAASWLRRLGVAGRAEARPHQLSGGEAQRVSIARALAVKPSILFMDEPFSGLDAGTRSRLVGEVRSLIRETGVTTLLTTHDLAEAAVLADRLLLLDQGRVLAVGRTRELLERPPTPAAASLLDFTIVDAAAATSLGIPSGGATAGISPSAVHIERSPARPGALPATIAAIEGGAGGVRLRLHVGGLTELVTTLDLTEFHAEEWAPGDSAYVTVAAERVVWWPADDLLGVRE